MKKSLITLSALGVLSTGVSAGDTFVGIEVVNIPMTRDIEYDVGPSAEKEMTMAGGKFKFGGGDPKDFVFDVYLATGDGDYEGTLYNRTEFGLELRGYAPTGSNLAFFYQLGYGYGIQEPEVTTYDDTTYLTINGGIGLSYTLSSLEFILGYNYYYQLLNRDYHSNIDSETASGMGFSFGLNYYFGGIGATTTNSSYQQENTTPSYQNNNNYNDSYDSGDESISTY